jgi:hypothetical protein
MKISIIIPCYNYGHLVEKAIASSATNHPEVEVIVLNDGSTDNSLAILEALTEKYSFTLINKINSGVSNTRNQGIELAQGDYLIFLDADDYLTDDAINLCLEAIRNTTAKFILAEHFNIKGAKRNKSKPLDISHRKYDNVRRYIRKELSIANGGCLMHRDIFASRRYNPLFSNSEDIPIFIHALANFATTIMASPIVNIVKHEDSRRHDIDAILATGTSIVDDSFDDKYIKGNIAKLKNLALAHRHSSIGRACFKDTKYQLAKHHYFTALSLKPSFAFNSNLVKRLVVSIIKCD